MREVQFCYVGYKGRLFITWVFRYRKRITKRVFFIPSMIQTGDGTQGYGTDVSWYGADPRLGTEVHGGPTIR